MGYIYCIENIENGKKYIGLTKDYVKRWYGHKRSFICGNRISTAMQNAINKYGVDKFKFYILIICFDDDMPYYEKEYIKKYKTLVKENGYNILEGGNSYRDVTEKDRNAIKEGQKRSEKWKKALEEKRIGRKNCKHSDEDKKKISESLKKYYKNNSNSKVSVNIEKHRQIMAKAVGRKVDQYDKDGKFIKTYDSISEAERNTGVSNKNIAHVLRGRSQTAGGYCWQYHEE